MNNINTDLVDAAVYGQLDEVRRLLDQGADINYFWTIHDINALMMATGEQNEDVVRLLLERGADTNIQNSDGDTALIFASMDDNNTEMIELLLSYGANIHMQNNQEETALIIAAQYHNQNNVMTLIMHENVTKIQRLTRRRNTRRRIKTIKNKKMLAFAKSQNRLSDFIGQDMDPQIYSNISNHVSNMKYDRMPRMIERVRVDPYTEWLQDRRSD